MSRIDALQRHADKMAERLGLDLRPHITLGESGCRMKGHYAHAHIFPRAKLYGQVCVNRTWLAHATVRQWRDTIAHEVTHFKVQNHSSVAFAKRMRQLGYADQREKLRLAAHGAWHKHQWVRYGFSHGVEGDYRRCLLCQKEQVGTITWKEV